MRTISNLDSSDVQHTFLPEDGLNPLRSLQIFCTQTYTSTPDCRRIGNYLVDMMVLQDGYNDSAPISSYKNDIILHAVDFDGISPPYIWGNIQLQIQLDSLQGLKECAYLTIPVFEMGLDESIYNFCIKHNLKGINCLELNYEIRNYLTCLYHNHNGVTLRNLAKYMITDEELIYMYFLVDIYSPTTLQLSRYYYVSSPTYFAMDGGKFCIKHQFTRSYCIQFFEYIHTKVKLYYNNNDNTIIPLLYVLYHIHNISKNNQENIIQKEKYYIDADFIEIGTSNFNAITQLIDMNEPITGYAIEPYKDYLDQLPSPPGVKKLNIAIVPDKKMVNNNYTSTSGGNSSSSSGSSSTNGNDNSSNHNPNSTTTSIDNQSIEYVDLYYIPEEIIDTLQLPPFLKGCNSINTIHSMHTEGGYQKYVQKQSVQALTITQLLTSERIRAIRLLKIDAELYDYVIVRELYHYLVAKQDTILYPQRIIFEINPYEITILKGLLQDYQGLGYTILYIADDVIMEYLLNPI